MAGSCTQVRVGSGTNGFLTYPSSHFMAFIEQGEEDSLRKAQQAQVKALKFADNQNVRTADVPFLRQGHSY